ncbi:flagellar basal-body MS-ring/collar protein FliF [Clostridium sp. OS1-26]|uniref:flagellar basal-body MS-ring/collar protein FliF n=1 Tax=Clostridium sp. OS1-26 TaxID=3070681 RepID=UPI0027DFAF91|nr:flagellar basal-body MS-ring/collar protein FliF [Clostridium sp. OS1-26]WML35444.1 flagellar basal-body MS-ring/collar protein FliF [Clostridium sp. OS1-26]
MGKLSQLLKNLVEKWKGLSRNKKIAYGIIVSGIIASIVFLSISLGKTKYDVLFSNMDPTDSAAVYKKLQDQKIDAKVSGNSILVPKDQVDKLRMQMLADVPLTNGSQGFELLDKSKFGSTDQEMKINYQRALQGELERTIKGFDEVENARVHIVLPDDTAFVKDTDPGKASVTIKLKSGAKLSEDQVKSIVSLISGSVKNIPKENVEVIDDKMNLLSKDLFNNNKDMSNSTTPAEKQQQLKQQYEKDVEKRLLSMLEAVYGKDKVKVKVNADLDFDAVQQDSVTYDPKSVVVSEHNVKDSSTTPNTRASNSPVDNNMTNTTANNNNNNGISTHEESTKNYNVPKVEQKTIKAPGAVKRLTASIALDGNVDPATITSVKNLAVSAIGFDNNRGDSISVEGIPFDTKSKDDVKKDLDAMNKAAQDVAKRKTYIIAGIVGAILLAAATAGFIAWRRKKKEEEELFEEELQSQGIDVIIGDEMDAAGGHPKFKPIDFETEDEKTHIENEIKKYAKEKPEQVADIVKSWLAEDER